MFRIKISTTIILLMLFFFALNANVAMAQDGRSKRQNGCVVPTVTGNVDKPEGWNSPKIYTSSEEVARNSFVKVWVNSEGYAKPQYSWSISGAGFHFDNVSGPTTATTNKDLEELDLWADDVACGSCTITVTDANGNTTTQYVRSDNGVWSLCYKKKGTMCYWDSCCNFVLNGHLINICNCGTGSSWHGCTTAECGDGFAFEACWPDLPDECSIPINNGMWKFYVYVWTCP